MYYVVCLVVGILLRYWGIIHKNVAGCHFNMTFPEKNKWKTCCIIVASKLKSQSMGLQFGKFKKPEKVVVWHWQLSRGRETNGRHVGLGPALLSFVAFTYCHFRYSLLQQYATRSGKVCNLRRCFISNKSDIRSNWFESRALLNLYLIDLAMFLLDWQ